MRLIFSLVFVCAAAFSQTADNLMFEVASVKPMATPEPGARLFFGPPRGGPGTNSPVQITWTNAALRSIVMTAYDVQTFLVVAPDWLATARYDIVAKVPAGATKAQVNGMWRNLVKERFGIVIHHELKELQVDTLTVAKGGLKLRETEDPNIEPLTPEAGPRKVDQNGIAQPNGSGAIVTIFPNATGATARMVVRALPLSEIAARLGGMLGRPVLERSGLTGKYDFVLEFTPDIAGLPRSADSASDPGSNIASAVEKQLGLKLTSSKEELDVIVVDHAEKIPTAN